MIVVLEIISATLSVGVYLCLVNPKIFADPRPLLADIFADRQSS